MNERERLFTLLPTELRAHGDRRSIGGYAAVFNKPSQNLGGFVEVVSRTFFNKSRSDGWPGLDGQGVIARYNHDDNMLLGSTGAGTLRLTLDETGLDYDVTPPEARADVLELVGRGDIRKSSFAFVTFEDEWGLTDQNFPQRTLVTGQLVDVAPVNLPAYTDTTVALSSLAAHVSAPLEEIRKLADDGELRRLFTRTGDSPPANTFGPAALAVLQSKQYTDR